MYTPTDTFGNMIILITGCSIAFYYWKMSRYFWYSRFKVNCAEEIHKKIQEHLKYWTRFKSSIIAMIIALVLFNSQVVLRYVWDLQ